MATLKISLSPIIQQVSSIHNPLLHEIVLLLWVKTSADMINVGHSNYYLGGINVGPSDTYLVILLIM
jgi:hypothetical protein